MSVLFHQCNQIKHWAGLVMKVKAVTPMHCCTRDHGQALMGTRLEHAAGQLSSAHIVMLEANALLKVGSDASDTRQSAGFQMLPLFVFVFA